MKSKHTYIYLLLITLLYIVGYVYAYWNGWRLEGDDAMSTVMIAVSFPVAGCLLSLLISNGFRCFRHDVIGIVNAVVLLLLSQVGTFLAYKLQYQYYSTSKEIIIYGLGMALAALLLLALHDTVEKQRNIDGKTSFLSLICRSLMYGTWVASLILFFSVNLSFPVLNNINHTMKGAFVRMEETFNLLGFIFIIASIAVFLILWIWKHTRLIASLVGLIAFSGLFFFTVVTFDQHMIRVYDREIGNKGHVKSYMDERIQEDDIYVVQEQEPIEVDDYEEESYQDSPDREDAYNPSFIGDGIIGVYDTEDREKGDTDSIASAIVFLKDDIHFDSTFPDLAYHILSYRQPFRVYKNGYGGKAYDGIVRLLWKNKKSIVFEALLSSYSHIIKEYISAQTYKDRGYDKMVEQLIVAYNDLSTQPESFGAIYWIMYSSEEEDICPDCWYGELYEKYYGMIKDYISEESLTVFNKPEDDYCRIVWVYSFWGRRDHEGIKEDVYKALLKLQEMYQE